MLAKAELTLFADYSVVPVIVRENIFLIPPYVQFFPEVSVILPPLVTVKAITNGEIERGEAFLEALPYLV
jgi:hypothetical protein